MKNGYLIYHRPLRDAQAANELGPFPTIDEARARTGHPSPADWRSAPHDEGLYLLAQPDAYGRTQEWMISEIEVPETDAERVTLAIRTALDFGSFDGDHHKQYALDQVVRILAGDRYEQVIAEWEAGEDGPETYSWDTGIAP
ncbi:MAG TPA: hypothetical protein VHA75_18300 [Rugosimonospora sp.]|nr:hypothetical protein [Rugosimonospora sp.]